MNGEMLDRRRRGRREELSVQVEGEIDGNARR